MWPEIPPAALSAGIVHLSCHDLLCHWVESTQVRSFDGFKLTPSCKLDLEDVIRCTSLQLTRLVAFAPSDASSPLSTKLQFLSMHVYHMFPVYMICQTDQYIRGVQRGEPRLNFGVMDLIRSCPSFSHRSCSI